MTSEAAEREIAKIAERLPDDITIRTIAEGFAALKAERDEARDELAQVREACPLVRRQDYFEAPTLKIVQDEISQMFQWQSRALASEAECERLREALQLGIALVSKEKGWGTYPRMEGSQLYHDADAFRNAGRAAMESKNAG